VIVGLGSHDCIDEWYTKAIPRTLEIQYLDRIKRDVGECGVWHIVYIKSLICLNDVKRRRVVLANSYRYAKGCWRWRESVPFTYV